MKVELHFSRKGFPQVGPVLIVKVDGEREAVEKIVEAVRKAAEEMATLEESSCISPTR